MNGCIHFRGTWMSLWFKFITGLNLLSQPIFHECKDQESEISPASKSFNLEVWIQNAPFVSCWRLAGIAVIENKSASAKSAAVCKIENTKCFPGEASCRFWAPPGGSGRVPRGRFLAGIYFVEQTHLSCDACSPSEQHQDRWRHLAKS